MHVLVVEAEGFSDTGAVDVTGRNADQIDTAATTLGLGDNIRVTLLFRCEGKLLQLPGRLFGSLEEI